MIPKVIEMQNFPTIVSMTTNHTPAADPGAVPRQHIPVITIFFISLKVYDSVETISKKLGKVGQLVGKIFDCARAQLMPCILILVVPIKENTRANISPCKYYFYILRSSIRTIITLRS